MLLRNLIFLCNFSLILIAPTKTHNETIDENFKQFIEQMNADHKEKQKSILEASWNYELTRNKRILKEKYNIMEEYEKLMKEADKQIKKFQWNIEGIGDNNLRNQFRKITYLIKTTYPAHLEKQIDEVFFEVNNIYTRLKTNRLEEDLNILKSMKDINSQYEKEKIIWRELLDIVTRDIQPQFKKYLSILKEKAKIRGLETPLEVISYEEGIAMRNIWLEVYWMLYKQQHFFNHLYYYYHKRLPQLNPHKRKHPEWEGIELHLIEDIHEDNPKLKPFPNVEDIIRKTILEKSTTIDWIKLANNYYSRMGFGNLDAKVMLEHIIKLNSTHSNGKTLKVWNLFDGDYRMSWTPTDPEEDVKNIFKGTGIIHNIIQFRNLPPINQNWPNEIFQEAIASAASMSSFSPHYLQKIGILQTTDNITNEIIINYQMKSILKMFNMKALLGAVTDASTLQVYDNKFRAEDFSIRWFSRIKERLNIDPPKEEAYSVRFGPGMIESMLPGSTHIKALQSVILTHQFFQKLCTMAGQFNPKKPEKLPLHMCDISSDSDNAIQLLKTVMKKGNTLSKEEMFYLMTGQIEYDFQPLFNYYDPLMKWLKKEAPLKRLKKFGNDFGELMRLLRDASHSPVTGGGVSGSTAAAIGGING